MRIGLGKGYVINSLTDRESTENHDGSQKYGMSPSIDIVMYDQLHNAPLSCEMSFQVFPVEMVLGCIEVTRYLDSKKLASDLEKLARVRRLADVKVYGRSYAAGPGTNRRPLAFIFAISSSISNKEIHRQVSSLHDELRPQAILILDRGLFVRRGASSDLLWIEENAFFHFFAYLRSRVERFGLGRTELRKYVDEAGSVLTLDGNTLAAEVAEAEDFDEFDDGGSDDRDDGWDDDD